MMVRIGHARRAGLCARGCRRFLRERGLDAAAFFRGPGIPVRELEAMDDAMVARACRVARAEAGGTGPDRGPETGA
ncbi:MAG: hypothetical protein AB7D57_01750 [Desulfovibrionaceae bacterium]